MAKHCVNIGSDQFKTLAEQSDLDILDLSATISLWQDENNTYEFPSIQEVNNFNYSKYGAKAISKGLDNNVYYQNNTDKPNEEFIASEKTIRDLAARMADRIGLKVRYESDRTLDYKGKLEGNTAVINLAHATLDTPIHEILGHPIIRAIKNYSTTKGFDWSGGNDAKLYQNLLKELETGKGKEVLDRVKKDYQLKSKPEIIELESMMSGKNTYEILAKEFESKEDAIKYQQEQTKYYSLEEQQEEAIVELLGLMTAGKLHNSKDGKIISLLKRLLKEMKSFMRSLLNQKEVEIDKLPDNMKLGDIADLLAYSNNKLILPGNEVKYTTPDNQTFKTYQEANNHISELVKLGEVDLGKVNFKINRIPDEFIVTSEETYRIFNEEGVWFEHFIGEEPSQISEQQAQQEWEDSIKYAPINVGTNQKITPSNIQAFIEKNKEYEQSKEIIEEWKKVNNIKYDPEEVYSRGQGFYSVVGAYSDFDVELMFQNLLTHIEDNKKAGGEFTISAFTKPVDKQIGHLEGGGGKIKFKIFPQSNDIKWAANTDVYSGSVWDASEKVNKDKKSEIVGVSYTKSPSLNSIDSVQPNLASIIDNLSHHHNELGIELTGNNFRLEYDDNVPYSTKKLLDRINGILDSKFGKLVEPSINTEYSPGRNTTYGISPITYRVKKRGVKFYAEAINEYDDAPEDLAFDMNNGDSFNSYNEFDTEEEANKGLIKLKHKIELLNGINKVKQPTQTNENLKESIDDIFIKTSREIIGTEYFIKVTKPSGGVDISLIYNSKEEALERLSTDKTQYKDSLVELIESPKYGKPVEKEYTTQAEINTKVAALKEGQRKYPRSLIRSEVVKSNITDNYVDETEDYDLPFQKVPNFNKEESEDITYNDKDEVLAPNGKVSKLYDDIKALDEITTDAQALEYYKQTRSNKFKEWFGESKVVDENGEPLMVYHGSANDNISVFNPTESDYSGVIYFTSHYKYADSYRAGAINRTTVSYKGFNYKYVGNKRFIKKMQGLPTEKLSVKEALSKYETTEEEYLEAADHHRKSGKIYPVFLKSSTLYDGVGEQLFGGMPANQEDADGFITDDDGGNAIIYAVKNPNQIKSVFNKGEFSKESDNIYDLNDLQAIQDLNDTDYTEDYPTVSKVPEAIQKKELTKVDARLLRFIEKLGISIEVIPNLKGTKGESLNALAVFDGINAVIQVANGDISSSDISEEVSHFFLELLGENHPLYKIMMSKIEKFDIYTKVKSQYSEAYDNDEIKIKKEAVGQLISENIINEGNLANKAHEGFLERWWNKTLEKLKSLFTGVKVSDNSAFLESARMILQQDNRGLKKIEELKPFYFYSLTEEQETQREVLLKLFKNGKIRYNAETSQYETLDGKPVPGRVSDIVRAEHIKKYGENTNKDVPKKDMLLANKGTVIHKYLELIVKQLVANDVNLTEVEPKDYLEQLIIEGKLQSPDKLKDSVYYELSSQEGLDDKAVSFYNLTTSQYAELVLGAMNLIKQIQKNTDVINKSIGKEHKAEIMTELIVYDNINNQGGTIDLAVVYPNGAVGIYDFKSINFLTRDNQIIGGITENKKYFYDVQLAQYKRILRDSYNVTEFAESRIIPINSKVKHDSKGENFAPDGFITIEMGSEDMNGNIREYLHQLPVAGELSLDKDLNRSIKKLYNLRDTVKTKLEKNPRDLDLQDKLATTNEIIRKLLVEQDISYVLDEVLKLRNLLDTDQTLLDGVEGKLTRSQLVDIYDYSKALAKIGANAGTILKNDKELSTKALGIDGVINLIQRDITNKLIEDLGKDELFNLDDPHKEIGFLGSLYKQVSEIDSPIFKKLSKLVIRNSEAVRKDINDVIKTVDAKDLELEKFAKSKGMKVMDIFKIIMNPNTGNLLGKYGKEFYKEKNKAVANKDEEWILKHLEVEKKGKGYAYTGEALIKYTENKEAYFEYLDKKLKRGLSLGMYEKAKEDFLIRSDITTNPNLLFSKKNYYLKIKDNPNRYTADWKFVSTNKAVKDYYDMYVNFNKIFNEITNREVGENHIAELRQDTFDRLTQTGVKAAGALRGSLINLLEAREYDVSKLQKDSEGNYIGTVPLLYMDKLKGNLTTDEKEKLKTEIKAKGYTPGTLEFTNAFNKAKTSAEIKKGGKFKSVDLSKSLILFAHSAYTNKHFNDSEDIARSLQIISKSDHISTTLTDGTGKKIHNKILNKISETLGIKADDSVLLDKFINNYWYGLHTQNKDILYSGKAKYDKDGNKIEDGVQLSANKTVKAILSYTAMRTLGFAILPQASDALNGIFNMYMTGAEGLHYTNKHMKRTQAMMTRRDKKYLAAIEYFEPSTRDLVNEKANKRSKSKLTKYATLDNLFIGFKKSDEMRANNILVSMMQHYGLDSNNKIKRLSTLPEGTKSMLEEFSYNKETNEMSFKRLPNEEFIRFRKMAQKIQGHVAGAMPQDDINAINLTVYGQALMQFRNWMPGMISNRFKTLTYDPQLEELDAGRFRILAGEIARSGSVTNTLKSLGNLLLEVSTYGYAKRYTGNKSSERATKIAYDKLVNELQEKGVKNIPTIEEFWEFRDAKMRGMAREMSMTLTMFSIAAILKALMPDDKKDVLTNMLAGNTARLSNRGLLELTFFFNPLSATTILKSPFASLSTVTSLSKLFANTTDETADLFVSDKKGRNKKKDPTPVGYYGSAMIPGAKGIIDFLNLFGKAIDK